MPNPGSNGGWDSVSFGNGTFAPGSAGSGSLLSAPPSSDYAPGAAGPGSLSAVPPPPPAPVKEIDYGPLTPEDLNKFAFVAPTLESESGGKEWGQDTFRWALRGALKDPKGFEAKLIKKTIAEYDAKQKDKEKANEKAYLSDVQAAEGPAGTDYLSNRENPLDKLTRMVSPEVSRAMGGVGSGVLGQILGAGEDISRDPLGGTARLLAKGVDTSNPLANAARAVRDIYERTTGKKADIPVTNSEGVDRLLNEIDKRGVIAKGGDAVDLTAEKAYRSFGRGSYATNLMTQANKKAEDIQSESSFSSLYDDGTLGGKVKGVVADAPFNIFKMIPLAAVGGAVGGATASLTEGIGAVEWMNPITKRVMSIDLGGLSARAIASVPEALGEAQSAAHAARKKAIELGMDPDRAASDALVNTFAGNIALLGVTNNFADGKLMLGTFMKKGEKELAAATAKAMAEEATKKFGKQLVWQKTKELGKDLLGDFVGEGAEEYFQKIISDMAGNPKANTWEDIKKSAFSQEAFLEFLGGAITGPIVGGGSKVFERGPATKEAPLVVEKPSSPVKAEDTASSGASNKKRSPAQLHEEYQNAIATADVPNTLPKKAITTALKSAAGLSETESDLAKELSFIMAQAPVGLDPINWFASTTEGKTAGPEAISALESTYNKLLAAHQQKFRTNEANAFMSTLDEDEQKQINDYMKGLREGTVAEAAPAAEEKGLYPGGATETGAVQGPQQNLTLTDQETEQLQAKWDELQKRKAAVDKGIFNGKAAASAATARMDEELKASEAKEKFKPEAYKKAKAALAAAVKTMSEASARALMSQEERTQLDLGKRYDEILAEEAKRLQTELHEQEVQHVAGGSHAMAHALRTAQGRPGAVLSQAELGEPMLPKGFGGPGLATRRVATESDSTVGPHQAGTIAPIAPAIKTDILKTIFRGMPEHGVLAANKHGVNTPRMARALRAMLAVARDMTSDRAKAVQALVRGMHLSTQEQRKVNAAYNDAIYAERVASLPVTKAAGEVLKQMAIDKKNGLSTEEQDLNAKTAVVTHPTLASIFKFAEELNLPVRVAMEAVLSVDKEARTGNIYPIKALSKAAVFPNVVKTMLKEIAKSEKGEDAAPAALFDTTTAAGKIQAQAYGIARVYIKEQLNKWRQYIKDNGSSLSDASKEWDSPTNPFRGWRGRNFVQSYINEQLKAKNEGRPGPKTDGEPVTKKKGRSWLMDTTDYTAVTKALLDAGLIKFDGKSYSIAGMQNASEVTLGIDPALAKLAWEVTVPKNDPNNIKPIHEITMDELLDGLTEEQKTILKMYHGIEVFAQTYLSEEKIGKLLKKSTEAVGKLLDYGQSVVASRYPNLATMAPAYAEELSRLLTPGDMFEDDYTRNFRENRLAELRAHLNLIAQLPGSFNPQTLKKGGISIDNAEDTRLNKGFFPSLHDLIIDMGAPDADIKARDEAGKTYFALVPAYLAAASKNIIWRSKEEQALVDKLKPEYDAARDAYLSAKSKVYRSVSPETRKILDWVKGAVPRKGVTYDAEGKRTGDSGGNKVEKNAVRAIERASAATQRKANAFAKSLGDILSEAFSAHLEGPEISDQVLYDVEEVVDDARRAYLANPNSPIKAAYHAAIMSLEESNLANEIGMDADGKWKVQNTFVDKLRESLKLGDHSTARRNAYEEKMKEAWTLGYQLEQLYKKQSSVLRKLRTVQANVDANRAALGNNKASVLELTTGIAESLFNLRINDSSNPLIPSTIKMVNGAIAAVEALPSVAGYTIPGFSELADAMRNLVATNSIEAANRVRDLAPTIQAELRNIDKTLKGVISGEELRGIRVQSAFELKANASAYVKQLDAAYVFITKMASYVQRSMATSKAAAGSKSTEEFASRGMKSSEQIQADLDEVMNLYKQQEALEKELKQSQIAAASFQKVVDKANTAVNNGVFQRDAAEKEAFRLSDSVLPASEAELREMLGPEEITPSTIVGEEQIDEEDLADEDMGVYEEGARNTKTGGLYREFRASGVGLKFTDTIGVAGRLVSAVQTAIENSKAGRLSAMQLDFATQSELEKFIVNLEHNGISEDDSLNMMFGMGAIAEIANSEHAGLLALEEKKRGQTKAERLAYTNDLVNKIHEALTKIDTQGRTPEMNRLMATYAVENLTGQRLQDSVVKKAVVEQIIAEKESNLAKELEAKKLKEEANAKAKANIVEGLAKTREEVAKNKALVEDAKETLANAATSTQFAPDAIIKGLITRSSGAPLATRKLIASMIEDFAAKFTEKYPKSALATDKEIAKSIKALKASGKKGSLAVTMGVDLITAAELSHASPEGAALLLTAGIIYAGYRLGMQNPNFAAVMERIGAKYNNTVSQIALKIRSMVKGISEYTARLMAAMFKDGVEPDKLRDKETAQTEQGFRDRPAKDNAGYITPDGVATMRDNAANYSDQATLWHAYRNADGTKQGRIFSFDLLRDKLLHPGMGNIPWGMGIGQDVVDAFGKVLGSMLLKAKAAGKRTAVFVGGNASGKSTLMSTAGALARYGIMQETSAYADTHLPAMFEFINANDIPTDVVYTIRPLPDMMRGAILRSIDEQRVITAFSFASTAINSMLNTAKFFRDGGIKNGSLIMMDTMSGTVYTGEQAAARLESLASQLNHRDLESKFRAEVAKILKEGNHAKLTDSVEAELRADLAGQWPKWLDGIIREGYRSPDERRSGVPERTGESVVARLSDPGVVDRGTLPVHTAMALDQNDVLETSLSLADEIAKAGETEDGGVQYLNGGIGLVGLNSFIDDALAPALKRLGEKVRKTTSPVDKQVMQNVHKFATSSVNQLVDIIRLHIYERDSIVGGLQPLLMKVENLRDSNPAAYRSISLAIHDSTVQERKISPKELASRYNMDEAGVAMYKDIVTQLKGIQNITAAAFDLWAAEAVNSMREEQENLEPGDEYKKRFMAIEDRIEKFEKDFAKDRRVIEKNPVFISLLRNPEGNRRLDLVGPDDEHIGMTHLTSKDATKEVAPEEIKRAIDEMLRQHAHKLWAENDMAGTPESWEMKVRRDYERGLIKSGSFKGAEFVPGGTQQMQDDSHTNIVKMVGGMMTTEVLSELMKNRGEGVTQEARDAMMRDLRFMTGASEVRGRLKHTRGNVAGYSEDLLMSLAMHAQSSGYMIASLKHSNETSNWLDNYKKTATVDQYNAALNYMLSSLTPQGKPGTVSKILGKFRAYTAYRALGFKASFAFANALQGATTSRPHLMAMYGGGYAFDALYQGSASAARSFLMLTKGLGMDLSKVDPQVFEAKMDEVFTFDNFKGVWATQEEADRMIPVVKAVMRKIIHGSVFKDVNVGMQIGIDDATASSVDRIVQSSKFKKGVETAKDVVSYGANKGENYNRMRDIITYVVGAATEQRREEGKQMARLGTVEITDDDYRRLTYSDLRAEMLSSMKNRYRGEDLTKAQLNALADDATVDRIMTFAERQSAHTNFNTSRGFGNNLIWGINRSTNTQALIRSSVLFRLYPINVLNAWRTDVAISARRLEAEGVKPSKAMVAQYKSTAYGALASMLLGGAFAPPLAGAFMDFLSFIWNQLVNRFKGTPRVTDIRKDFVNWVYDNNHPYAARFISAGIFGLTPLYGLGAQLSMGESPLSYDSGKSWKENVANAALGSETGMVEGALRGAQRVGRGDVVGGMANILLPGGMSRGVDAMVNGTYTPNRSIPEGERDFYEMSALDKAVATLGVTPYKSSMIYENDNENYKLVAARKDILQRMQEAANSGELSDKDFEELNKWNEAMVEREREDMIASPRLGPSSGRAKRSAMNQQRVTQKIGD